MLELLRSSHATQRITLTSEFKRDLNWFATFLPKYNGVSLYDHRPIDMALHLDTCLTGFGGRCGQFVYHLPIARGFRNWTIVHLEMVNMLLVMRLFANIWSSKKILINCDNQAVVTVLTMSKTCDTFLAACARNIWYVTAIHDSEVQYKDVTGASNEVADVLSRWQGSPAQVEFLYSQVANPQWLNVTCWNCTLTFSCVIFNCNMLQHVVVISSCVMPVRGLAMYIRFKTLICRGLLVFNL